MERDFKLMQLFLFSVHNLSWAFFQVTQLPLKEITGFLRASGKFKWKVVSEYQSCLLNIQTFLPACLSLALLHSLQCLFLPPQDCRAWFLFSLSNFFLKTFTRFCSYFRHTLVSNTDFIEKSCLENSPCMFPIESKEKEI